MSSQVIEGVVNFSNVTKHDVYNGQDTGTFSMTITMSEDDAATLAAQGVKIKEYEGNKQRKFKSKYTIGMYNSEGDRFEGEVPSCPRYSNLSGGCEGARVSRSI
jgi:hypothetical protein